VQELVVRLRELKDGLGLSMAALARKTAYSKSSWERYLNGTTLPPRQAVEMLAQLSGTESARLLALWEVAEHAWGKQRSARKSAPGADSIATDASSALRRRPQWILVAAGIVAALAVCGVAVWLTSMHRSGHRGSAGPAGYSCHFTRLDGHLYAGHSTTTQRLVALNAAGQDVVEVQCLLGRHGCNPGRTDGLFGQHTENAVKKLQRESGAVVDGIVGPQTWALLRR
jgi:transcriptional regulator with XRE-family HTH domain